MKNEKPLPIEFSFGKLTYQGTFEKKKGKGNKVYFHTIFSDGNFPEIKFDEKFLPSQNQIIEQGTY